jgi:hypothetical protein
MSHLSSIPQPTPSLTPYRLALLTALGLLSGTDPAPAAATNNWQFKAELTLKEGYDANVYIQNEKPDPANVTAAKAAGLNAVSAYKGSSVTTILPRFAFTYQPCEHFNLLASYAPEMVYYPAAHSEDYIANRGVLNFGGRMEEVTYELNNAATYIAGNDLGPTFARPGDIPAIGGVPLRDRRESFVFRNNFKLTYPVKDFFVRPVCSTVFWDFMTDQKPSPVPTQWVYENYIDRHDISGGLDLGYKVNDKTALVLGYRYGSQDQGDLLGASSPYDNTYHRVLVGVEGTPWKWLKLGVMVGPDIRDFYNTAGLSQPSYAAFDRDELLWFVDATVTFIPTAKDTLTLFNRRFEHPAYASLSVYEDITYSAVWRHKLNDHFTFGAGFQVYVGDWQAPVSREDWIYTPSASIAYSYKKLNLELAYSYDWVQNKAEVIPGTQTAYAEGREYNRSLVTLSGRYSF